ncbi:uroporphyrinogen-III synthase [Xylella fastidiosa Mul-MD]|nr:uroporphyrinogen-III synthase [Xylella fastidiosa MUL0034]EWG13960.1 uroporphyrinogen-III synthase [Xylella fastidiosa Mul-MD]
MHTMTRPDQARTPWYLLSLRPANNHAALRRAVARYGGGLIALSPWRLKRLDSPETRSALASALTASTLVFTSPEAVRAAHALQTLRTSPGQVWLCVGASTARVLQHCGITRVLHPTQMNSEGLLTLLAQQPPTEVGLITAPGGRDLLQQKLLENGIRLHRADVYERQPLRLRTATLDTLQRNATRSLLALSSAEALALLLPQWPDNLRRILYQRPVIATSKRLEDLACARGFISVYRTTGPLPRQLAATAAAFRPDKTAQ